MILFTSFLITVLLHLLVSNNFTFYINNQKLTAWHEKWVYEFVRRLKTYILFTFPGAASAYLGAAGAYLGAASAYLGAASAYLSESENKANLGAHAKLCGHFCCDSSLTINSHDGVADMG